MKQRFFRCEHCGNIITMVKDAGVPVMCCGQKMTELIPGSVDAAAEKHLPVFTAEGNKVYVVVGDVEHPMNAKHYIEWISIQTKYGSQKRILTPTDKPAACFSLGSGDEVEAVYAYCNLHGLWMSENKAAPACELPPVNTDTKENYMVCKCNNVSYFDIIEAVHGSADMNGLLSLFDNVKNSTHCSTGCGGCYGKVISIISDMMSGKDL